MYIKSSRLKRVKNGITCSVECANKLRSIYMQGDQNHQFGLIGEQNASFKSGCLVTNLGYVLESCMGHPYPHDRSKKSSRVLQHRLIVERNHQLFNESYFECINSRIVLKPEFEVHHINENKQDNRVENLQIMTKSEHMSLHSFNKELIRDNLGRIIGVVKLSNIGESCDANPEINSEISKGSESSYSVGDE